MTGKRKILITVLAVFVVCLLTAVCLAFSGGGYDKPAGNSAAEVLYKIRNAEIKGGNLELSKEDINGLLGEILGKPVTRKEVTIEGGYVDIKQENLRFYSKIKYRGINLVLSINGKLQYTDDFAVYDIYSVKIGYMPLPKSVLINRLKKYTSEDIKISGSKVLISRYLFPFKISNLYIKDNKIIAEIEKKTAGQQLKTNYVSQNISSNTAGSGKASSTPNQSDSNGTSGGNQASNSQRKSSQNSSSNAGYEKSLYKVSSQMSGVIASVTTSREKQMMAKIQRVVNEVAKNPDYPYQSEANEVKAWYLSLPPEEKARVKEAILSHVDVTNVLKLLNIFGV